MNKYQADAVAYAIQERFPYDLIVETSSYRVNGSDGKRYSYWLVEVHTKGSHSGRHKSVVFRSFLEWKIFITQFEVFSK